MLILILILILRSIQFMPIRLNHEKRVSFRNSYSPRCHFIQASRTSLLQESDGDTGGSNEAGDWAVGGSGANCWDDRGRWVHHTSAGGHWHASSVAAGRVHTGWSRGGRWALWLLSKQLKYA